MRNDMQSTIDIVIGYSLASKSDAEKKKTAVSPYTRELTDVQFIVPSLEKAVVYRAAGRGKESGKLSVGCAAANFIRKHSHDAGMTPRFVGFGVQDFLRFVGFECAVSQVYFPSNLWFNSPDIAELHDLLSLEGNSVPSALTYFSQGFSGEDLEAYTALVKGWAPHKDAERDATLSFMFGSLFWLWGNP
jgi:hypothetical protein